MLTASGIPFLGSLITFMIHSDLLKTPHNALLYFSKQYPSTPLLRISFGVIPRPDLILVQDPVIAKRILQNSEGFPKGQTYVNSFRGVTPHHLPGLDDTPETLKKRRLAASLLSEINKSIQPVIYKEAEVLVDALRSSTVDKPLELYTALQTYTLNIISSAVFGEPISEPVIKSSLHCIMEEWQHRSNEIVSAQHWGWWPRQRRLRRAQDTMDKFLRQKISEARQNKLKPCILINALNKESNDDIIVDVCFTLISMGHDNVASSLLWMLILGPVCNNSVEHIIKESMRLYPSTTVLSRRAASSEVLQTELGIQEYDPANLEFIISPFVLHRLSAIWGPSSEEYCPGRWSDGNHKTTEAYMPFGIGHRACIGQQIANAQIHAVLNAIANSGLSIHLTSESKYVKPIMNVFLKPDRNVMVFCDPINCNMSMV